MAASLLAGALALSTAAAGASGAPTFRSDLTYATPSYQPGPIACSGTGTCLRLDFGDQWTEANDDNVTVARTTNGGATWAVVGPVPVPSERPLGGAASTTLSCPSPTVCIADLNGQLDRTLDGGTKWVVLTGPANALLLTAACLPSGGCVALGTNLNGNDVTSYWATPRGHTFVRTSGLRGNDEYGGSISCPSTTRCLAVAESGDTGVEYATENPGPKATWTTVSTLPTNDALVDVSCATNLVCLGIWTATHRTTLSELARSTDGGKAWTTTPLAYPTSRKAGNLLSADVSCSSSLSCVASYAFDSVSAGPSYARTIVTDNAGRTYTTRTTLQVKSTSGIDLLDAFGDCLTANHCVADVGAGAAYVRLGGYVETTANEVNWTPIASPYSPTSSTSLDCTTDDTCYRIDEVLGTAGYRSQLLVSANDGTTWQDVAVPGGDQPMLLGGCQTAQVCEVVATTGSSLLGGIEGQGFAQFTGARVVLLTTSNGGASWSSSPATTAGAVPVAASCTSTLTCALLVERTGPITPSIDVVTTTNGTVWSSSVSGLSPYVVQSPVLDANVDQFVLSCASGGFCMYGGLPDGAGGPVLYATTNGGVGWAKLPTLHGDDSLWLESLDCTAAEDCILEYATIAGSYETDVVRTSDGGSAWGAPSQVTTSSTAPSASLSCTTTLLCTTVVAQVFASPHVLSTVDGGTSWTDDTWAGPTPTPKDEGFSLVGELACSPTACLDLDETVLLARGEVGSMTLVQAVL
jgi:hypothetical protein